eukprot:m.830784 g.830784  ORF g.830784 m.830784 type:complete len:199 (-) comp23425_c1_seq17:1815-2411(-)
MEKSYDYIFKFLLLGNSGVGKTSFLVQFVDGIFVGSCVDSTVAAGFKVQYVETQGKTVKVQFWDTQGQERFTSISASYYKGARVAIIAYDATEAESFETIRFWLQELRKYSPPNIIKIVVGNKADLTNQIKVDPKMAKVVSIYHHCFTSLVHSFIMCFQLLECGVPLQVNFCTCFKSVTTSCSVPFICQRGCSLAKNL